MHQRIYFPIKVVALTFHLLREFSYQFIVPICKINTSPVSIEVLQDIILRDIDGFFLVFWWHHERLVLRL